MRKLSKTEWIAVAAAVIVVAYTLFGGSIAGLFQSELTDNLAAVAGPSTSSNGVVINDLLEGQGAQIKPGQLVTIHYVLSLPDGTLVQNSKDLGTPFQFVAGANEVIPGLETGLSGMKIGGVRTVMIPPELAYGENQVGPIPPNSTLIFTVELIDATDTPAQAVQ